MFAIVVGLLAFQSAQATTDVGPLVRSFWLLQRYGTADATNPANDHRVKGVLAKAIAKDGEITLPELGGFMQPEVFSKLAGADGKIDAGDVDKALAEATPDSRTKLSPQGPGTCRFSHDDLRHD